jgi:hypothetical protein
MGAVTITKKLHESITMKQLIHLIVRGHVKCAVLATVLLAGPAANAQQTCPVDSPIGGWNSADVASWRVGSAALDGAGRIQLCSATRGLAEAEDGYRFAIQPVEGDFSSEATIVAIDPGATGGLIATGIAMPGAQSARIAIVADPQADPNTVRLRVTYRLREGDAAAWATLQPVVELPVRLTIKQQAGVLFAQYEYGGVAALLYSTPLSGTDLSGALRVGMVTASNNTEHYRSAWFIRPHATLPELPPEAQCSVSPVVQGDAQTFAIKGRFLDHATEVLVGGVPAEIVAQSRQRLVLRVTPSGSGMARNEVVVKTRYSNSSMPVAVVLGGTPIIRGDVNQDGKVTRDDWTQMCHALYRSMPPSCYAAGDVDGNGVLEQGDLDQLKLYLTTGERPPIGPFPSPGFVAGTLSCTALVGPVLTEIVNANGRPIRRTLRVGDVIMLRGARLPIASRAVVMFGMTRTEVVAEGTPAELRLRIVSVPSTGKYCPIILDSPIGDGFQSTRFGVAHTVNDTSPLCLSFEAPQTGRALVALAQKDGRTTLSIPRSAFTPGKRLDVNAAYLMPFVEGKIAGPRVTQFLFQVASSEARGDAYGDNLSRLAQVLAKNLNGHNDGACECEIKVTPMPSKEQLIVAPCTPIPPPPPDPNLPGLPTQIKAIRQIVGGISILNNIPAPSCDEEFDPNTDPRQFGWCNFLKAVSPAANGLPKFESFRPIDTISGMNATVADLKPPHLRTTADKKILFQADGNAWADLFDGDYTDPCHLALRANNCVDGFFNEWVRPLQMGTQIIKTEWRTASRLPFHMDTNSMYHYVDPKGEIQYLVAMHVGVSSQIAGKVQGYWRWNTFWAPLPFGDTITKNGQDVKGSFSPYCTTGSGNDRPIAFANSAFANWHMCTDSANGEKACGNPWIAGECVQNAATSCTGCHSDSHNGHQSLASAQHPEFHDLATGWLASVNTRTSARATACVQQVLDHPEDFVEWLEPQHADNLPSACHFPVLSPF